MYLEKSLPPRLSIDAAINIAQEIYGLKVSAKKLVSDIGQNLYLRDDTGKEYVLKIANPAEHEEILNAQNQVLDYIARYNPKIQAPRLCISKAERKIEKVLDEDGNYYYARLLTYIPGEFLAHVTPHTTKLLYSLGEFLAQLDKTLQGFYHPATLRYWHWDLKHLADLKPYTKYIANVHNRRLCDYFVMQFENSVQSVLPELRSSVIHNDANDHNILVKKRGNGDRKVIGILDFGDMVYSYTIFELAIALAYVMMEKDDPLAYAIPVLKGYNKVFPLEEREIEVLFYLIIARLCISSIMAAYQQQLQPDNEYLSISEKQAWKLLEKMLVINPERAQRIFRESCNMPKRVPAGMSINSIMETRAKHIGKSLRVSYRSPLKIIRGAMQYLFDEEGDTYLDCVNNVCHVGHCHPHVVRAAQKQIALLNTNTRYLHEYLIQYARRLTATMPDPLNVCYIVNSGSEANELALRLAHTHTHQKDCIIVDHGYHGNTSALIELSPYKFDGPGGSGAAAHIHKVIMPDTYRGPYKDAQAGKKYARHIIDAVAKIQDRNRGVAAFFCESLLSCAGQIILPKGYLKEAYKQVRQAGGICIADEVQVGFGRVGTHFWGFETQDVIPDIVTLGKAIGNGHPLAAVITSAEIAQSFDNGMEYFNTFGGNPVSCAVGMAVLDVVKQEGLQKNALKVGNYFKNRLCELKEDHDLIGDVRGMGLFLGVELVTDRDTLEPAAKEATYLIERMKEQGILLSIDGPLRNVLKIKPPMVFTKENVDFVVERLAIILRELN